MNLYIREKNKRYRPATDDEVLAETRTISERLFAPKVKFSDPTATKLYLTNRFIGLDHEVFMGLFVNSQHELIEAVELAKGTIDAASVYPREVVKAALKHKAAAVIFAHPHPSGTPEPSTADRLLTDRLRQALALIDVRTLDHFVVGGDNVTSFVERGWL